MSMLLKKRNFGKRKDLAVIAVRSMGDAYVKKERKTSFPKSQQKQCRKTNSISLLCCSLLGNKSDNFE